VTVADRIRGLMAQQRVTVGSISKFFGVSARTWSNWMKDPETQLNIGRLRVIASLLHTDCGTLIGGDE
jgi:hypothetical protein